MIENETAIVRGRVAKPGTDFIYTKQIPDDIIDNFLDSYHNGELDKMFRSTAGESVGDIAMSMIMSQKDASHPGVAHNSFVDREIKESWDMSIINTVICPVANALAYAVDDVMDAYITEYPFAAQGEYFQMDPGWNVQKYPVGGGYKSWHTERCSGGKANVYRHIVWMVYLTDNPNGGTEFFHQNHYLPATKGTCVLWPTDWTYTHKSRPDKEREKIIATGWYSFTT